MYSFKNDYSEGAHPSILKALAEANMEQVDGYGEDRYTLSAVEKIKQQIGCAEVDIHFLSGGTQTNLTAISAFLRPHEAAVSANTGHVLVHETGAIEATGHKVLSVESGDGKLTPESIRKMVEVHNDEHMVKPRLVYLSLPTEVGTIYSKKEMEAISSFCRKNNLLLYVDGARLGSALCAEGSDVTLEDLSQWVDAFYIGGTKNGALLGEALVICRDSLKEDFRYHMKQKGALLAKGQVLGLQFLSLFTDNLYFELADYANKMAVRIRTEISQAGYSFLTDSPTNQIFPILPNALIAKMQKNYSFHIWSAIDPERSVIRLVTSWATREEAVTRFLEDFHRLRQEP